MPQECTALAPMPKRVACLGHLGRHSACFSQGPGFEPAGVAVQRAESDIRVWSKKGGALKMYTQLAPNWQTAYTSTQAEMYLG